MTAASLAARREQALGAGAPLFYRSPLHIVRGEGAYLFDADGRRYVDMYNNVPCVGHANPRVVEAMTRQQATLNVHSRYLHEGVVAFAERLAALHGPQIESVVFSCSGTEANEVALRMARFATGRRGIVFTDATYHGNSDLVSQLTRSGSAGPANPELRAIPFPQMYRPLVAGLSEAELADSYLERLRLAIESLEREGAGLAALIVCSIFANEGLPDVPRGFMARAAEMVRAAGGLVIADEVQAGYGRTGGWWGYDVTGFAPDIAVTGKPMGNGLPLAATAASRPLVDGFRARTRYFNTFASSPLQAAVGMAVLDVIEDEGLLANVATVGGELQQALARRKPAWDAIGDVRGHGLFIGVEMVKEPAVKTPDAATAAEVSNRLKDRGFLTAPAGAFGNVVKIRPPLVFSRSDAEAFLEAFDAVVAELHG
jgi:4-aminobutyrate aminotransferase-like enzyme